MDARRKKIKRGSFGYKIRRLNSSRGSKNKSSSISISASDQSILRHKNKKLAAALNQTRLENVALCQKLNQINGENLDLRSEIGGLKREMTSNEAENLELRREISELQREKHLITSTARATESDIQRKLGEIIGPIKTSLQQAFNHNLGLTENLSNSIDMLDSLQKQNSQSQNRLSEELKSKWFQKSKETPQATVSPRVMGYEILKPKIRISRMDMSAYQRQEEPEESEASDRFLSSRRRRRRNPEPEPDLSSIEESEETEAETILIYPRIVLDRIRLTPTRTIPRRQSEENSEADQGERGGGETPRARESFEDFTRRLGGLDPMEGPSWLFADEEGPGTSNQAKSRETKRQENSLKARLSSASRRLSLENPEEEEPRRRGGARAAAKAARGALKEPAMNTKLRQGDPTSTSVYDDFVPGSKRKSDRKSSKSSKKKKSEEK